MGNKNRKKNSGILADNLGKHIIGGGGGILARIL